MMFKFLFCYRISCTGICVSLIKLLAFWHFSQPFGSTTPSANNSRLFCVLCLMSGKTPLLVQEYHFAPVLFCPSVKCYLVSNVHDYQFITVCIFALSHLLSLWL